MRLWWHCKKENDHADQWIRRWKPKKTRNSITQPAELNVGGTIYQEVTSVDRACDKIDRCRATDLDLVALVALTTASSGGQSDVLEVKLSAVDESGVTAAALASLWHPIIIIIIIVIIVGTLAIINVESFIETASASLSIVWCRACRRRLSVSFSAAHDRIVTVTISRLT